MLTRLYIYMACGDQAWVFGRYSNILYVSCVEVKMHESVFSKDEQTNLN